MYPTDELPSTFEECKQLYMFFVSMSSSGPHPREVTIQGLKTTLQYRLMKFVCPRGLLESELLFVRSFEKQFPQFYFTVPPDLLRHKVCDCARITTLASNCDQDVVSDVSLDTTSLEDNSELDARRDVQELKSSECDSVPPTSSYGSYYCEPQVLPVSDQCRSDVPELNVRDTSTDRVIHNVYTECSPPNVCVETAHTSSQNTSDDGHITHPDVLLRQSSSPHVRCYHQSKKTKRRRANRNSRRKAPKPQTVTVGSGGFDTCYDEVDDRVRLRESYRHTIFTYDGHTFDLEFLDRYFGLDPSFRYGRAVYAMHPLDGENPFSYALDRYRKYDLLPEQSSLHYLALKKFIVAWGGWRPPE